jgi:alkylmercury lyase
VLLPYRKWCRRLKRCYLVSDTPALSGLDGLIECLLQDTPPLRTEDQQLAVRLFQTLARGRPVAVSRRRGGITSGGALERLLSCFPSTIRQGEKIVAFGGLSLAPTAHRFIVRGTVLYTWCAWDGLFLPELLGADALIESRCSLTGETIQLSVDSEGVGTRIPDHVWISMVNCSIGTHDVVDAFCRHVNFQAIPNKPRSGAGSFLLSIDEAFELGRRVNAARFGAALTSA